MQPKRSSAKLQLILILMIALTIMSSCTFLAPSVQSGDVLFQDDFEISTSGWDRYRDSRYNAGYGQGTYYLEVYSPDTMVWSLPNLNYADVIMRVQAWRSAGPEDNLYGLLCRYQDPSNFIFFVISSDGFAGIGHYSDGVRKLITDDSLLPVEQIRSGDNINLLEVECIGNKLSLAINGQKAAQATVENVVSGDVGLLAGTYDQAGVEIRFDNFSMLQP